MFLSLTLTMKYSLFVVVLVLGTTFGSPTVENIDAPHPAYHKDIKLPSGPSSKIVNGKDAERNEFPYQVSLQWGAASSFSHICGASVISENVVVTAAHCVMSYGSYIAVAGNLIRTETTAATQSRQVNEIIVHAEWPGGNSVSPYDIALMIVAVPFTWSESVQPIRLPVQDENHSGTAVVSGWGTLTGTSSSLPLILQYTEMEILTTNECANALVSIMGSSGPLDETMLCTSGADEISVCSGDSGGPLVQYGALVGIVSWGISPCGTRNAPSVFTRTSEYVNWINQNLQ